MPSHTDEYSYLFTSTPSVFHPTHLPVRFLVLGSYQERCIQHWCSRSMVSAQAVGNQNKWVWKDDVRRKAEQPHLSATVQARRLSLSGHTPWMPDKSDVKWYRRDAGAPVLPSRTWNHWTSPWMKQLTWLRIIHSGEWCLRLALRTLVVHKWMNELHLPLAVSSWGLRLKAGMIDSVLVSFSRTSYSTASQYTCATKTSVKTVFGVNSKSFGFNVASGCNATARLIALYKYSY